MAQSPQLYKQMCISSGFGRVYEVGPVFRAEHSHTHRHLCEFIGLDLEMEIYESYTEILVLLGDLMKHIFKAVEARCSKEMSIVRTQYDLTAPEPLVWADETVIVTFCDGIKMLQEAGYEASPLDDLSTENERALGKLIKEKYNTDFYILDKFPLNARPFTPCPIPTTAGTLIVMTCSFVAKRYAQGPSVFTIRSSWRSSAESATWIQSL